MVKEIAICDDVEVERFVLRRQLMAYFRTTGGKVEVQEFQLDMFLFLERHYS